mmetsp:Transcript_13132/g.31116  ORF Transcript_13132/g.31116 Transcript_13132/m.31116 type:complete len:312 (+) Transcript_13132:2501-3436(+)
MLLKHSVTKALVHKLVAIPVIETYSSLHGWGGVVKKRENHLVSETVSAGWRKDGHCRHLQLLPEEVGELLLECLVAGRHQRAISYASYHRCADQDDLIRPDSNGRLHLAVGDLGSQDLGEIGLELVALYTQSALLLVPNNRERKLGANHDEFAPRSCWLLVGGEDGGFCPLPAVHPKAACLDLSLQKELGGSFLCLFPQSTRVWGAFVDRACPSAFVQRRQKCLWRMIAALRPQSTRDLPVDALPRHRAVRTFQVARGQAAVGRGTTTRSGHRSVVALVGTIATLCTMSFHSRKPVAASFHATMYFVSGRV